MSKSFIAVLDQIAIQRLDDGRISFQAPSMAATDDQPAPKGLEKNPEFMPDSSMPGLDPAKDQFISLPDKLAKIAPELKFGSIVQVYSSETKQFAPVAIVGSIGFSKRLGQISYPLARALGIAATSSGLERHLLDFTITPKT